jgi:hypothetical protein
MKLSIEHTFALPPADYVDLYFDEPFSIELCAAVKLGRTLLRLDRTPERLVRHVRVEPIRDIPTPIAKVLAGRNFHYIEELEIDLRTFRGQWRVAPSLVPDKVEASGTLDFEDAGGHVKRVVRGDVKVAVFGIGGLVERFVVGEVEKSYDDASSYTRAFLERRRG